MAQLSGHRVSLGALFAGMSLIGLVMYGVIAWVPTFFARTYGMDVSQAGLWFGIIMAIGGAAGLVMGGTLADRTFAREIGRRSGRERGCMSGWISVGGVKLKKQYRIKNEE